MSKPAICYFSFRVYHLMTKRSDAQAVGGAELQGYLISKELARRGFRVSIVTRPVDPGEVDPDIPFTLIPTFSKTGGIPVLRSFTRFIRIIRALWKSEADVYYVNIAAYVLAPLVIAARLRKKKVIFWGASDVHFDPRFPRFGQPNTRDKALYVWGLKRCDAHIAQNRVQQDLMRRHFGVESRVIYNGLQQKEKVSTFSGEVLWVSGHIRKIKNPRLFLNVVRALPDVKFVMVGGNPADKDRFQSEILSEAAGIPNLTVKGFLPFDEVEKLFEHASVLLCTSHTEGFPNTFLQAWSRGIPVVSPANVNPDGLITVYDLGRTVEDEKEMIAAVSGYVTGKIPYAPEKIKAFFDRTFTLGAIVDRFEEVIAEVAHRGSGGTTLIEKED
jgi:glycosyltransferase involved in cell wall biosynthesis